MKGTLNECLKDYNYKFTKIVICVSRLKSAFFCPSLSFLAEAQPRLDNRQGQKALFSRGGH
jgi:hypothetical protein